MSEMILSNIKKSLQPSVKPYHRTYAAYTLHPLVSRSTVVGLSCYLFTSGTVEKLLVNVLDDECILTPRATLEARNLSLWNRREM